MLSLNESSWNLVRRAKEQADRLKIRAHRIAETTVLDFGVEVRGGIEAGICLADICMAGRSNLQVTRSTENPELPRVQVQTDHPLEACIGAQYAGWEFQIADFFAMTSGPARCLLSEPEAIIVAAGIRESANCAVGVMETRKIPDAEVVKKFAEQCRLPANRVAICVAPTASFAGSIQIVARSIETTLHKLHELGFDLRQVVSGFGSAPIPLIGQDDLVSLGWTNDCILYGADVTIWLEADDDELTSVGKQMPSSASRDFGQPFLELFKQYDCDFYKVDKMLFSPAQVTFNNLKSGRSMTFGKTRMDLVRHAMNLSPN